jgi:trehalose 6-phosphate phosphatase
VLPRAFAEHPQRALIALDYDGTLAPIVAVPEHAVPAPGAMAALARCAGVFGTVAIVTGRSARSLVDVAGLEHAGGLDRLVVLGHYGNERWTPAHGLASPPQHPGLPYARQALALLLRDAPDGVRIEDKGLSLAVHTRQAADPEAALAEVTTVVAQVAADTGLELQHGRLFVELRAPGSLDKGSALRALLAETMPGAVLFAGDDEVDRPAYAVLDEVREAGRSAYGVFVDNAEAPPDLRDRADLVVPDQAAVVALLDRLAEEARR